MFACHSVLRSWVSGRLRGALTGGRNVLVRLVVGSGFLDRQSNDRRLLDVVSVYRRRRQQTQEERWRNPRRASGQSEWSRRRHWGAPMPHLSSVEPNLRVTSCPMCTLRLTEKQFPHSYRFSSSQLCNDSRPNSLFVYFSILKSVLHKNFESSQAVNVSAAHTKIS